MPWFKITQLLARLAQVRSSVRRSIASATFIIKVLILYGMLPYNKIDDSYNLVEAPMSQAVTKNSEEKPERSKSERLEASITREQKELFQQAADIQGRTLTDFVISSVADAAKRVIQEHEMMVLSVRDREVFVEALLNPPEPSDKLRAAASRYKQIIGASSDASGT